MIINPDTQYNRITNSIEQDVTFWARKTESTLKNPIFEPQKLKAPSKTHFLSPKNWKCLQKPNFWVRKTESAFKNPLFEPGKPKVPSKTHFLSPKNWKRLQKLNFWARKTERELKNSVFKQKTQKARAPCLPTPRTGFPRFFYSLRI